MNKKRWLIFVVMIFLVPSVYAGVVEIFPKNVYPGDILTIQINPTSDSGFLKYIYIREVGQAVNLENTITLTCNIPISGSDDCSGSQIINYEVPYLIASRAAGEYVVGVYDRGSNAWVESESFILGVPEEPQPGGVVISDIISDGYIKYSADSNRYDIIDDGIAMIFTGSLKSNEQTYNLGYALFDIRGIPDNSIVREVWLSLTQKPYKVRSDALSWLLKRDVYYPVSYLQSNLKVVGSTISPTGLEVSDVYNELKTNDKVYYNSVPIEWGYNVPHIIKLGVNGVEDLQSQLDKDYFVIGLRTKDNPAVRDYIKFYDIESGLEFSPKLIVSYEDSGGILTFGDLVCTNNPDCLVLNEAEFNILDKENKYVDGVSFSETSNYLIYDDKTAFKVYDDGQYFGDLFFDGNAILTHDTTKLEYFYGVSSFLRDNNVIFENAATFCEINYPIRMSCSFTIQTGEDVDVLDVEFEYIGDGKLEIVSYEVVKKDAIKFNNEVFSVYEGNVKEGEMISNGFAIDSSLFGELGVKDLESGTLQDYEALCLIDDSESKFICYGILRDKLLGIIDGGIVEVIIGAPGSGGGGSGGGGGGGGGGSGGGTNILRGPEHNISALDVSQTFSSLGEELEEPIQLVDVIRPVEQPLAEPCIGDGCEEFGIRWWWILIAAILVGIIGGVIWYYTSYKKKGKVVKKRKKPKKGRKK